MVAAVRASFLRPLWGLPTQTRRWAGKPTMLPVIRGRLGTGGGEKEACGARGTPVRAPCQTRLKCSSCPCLVLTERLGLMWELLSMKTIHVSATLLCGWRSAAGPLLSGLPPKHHRIRGTKDSSCGVMPTGFWNSHPEEVPTDGLLLRTSG